MTSRTRSSDALAFDTFLGVVDSTWSRPPGPSVRCLALDLDAGLARVHEVELVLRVVEVVEALVPRWVHDRVHPERGHPERLAHLAEAVSLAELVDRAEGVSHRYSFPSSR